jgi:hypothetical protein
MPADERHCRARIVATLLASILTTLFESPSALAETPDSSAQQEPIATQDTAEESDRRNNGSDITRPQTAFEIRGLDQTSSNDTSKTNTAQMLLRITSKIPLDVGWRMGLRGFWSEVQRSYEKRICTSLPSSLRIA